MAAGQKGERYTCCGPIETREVSNYKELDVDNDIKTNLRSWRAKRALIVKNSCLMVDV